MSLPQINHNCNANELNQKFHWLKSNIRVVENAMNFVWAKHVKFYWKKKLVFFFFKSQKLFFLFRKFQSQSRGTLVLHIFLYINYVSNIKQYCDSKNWTVFGYGWKWLTIALSVRLTHSRLPGWASVFLFCFYCFCTRDTCLYKNGGMLCFKQLIALTYKWILD